MRLIVDIGGGNLLAGFCFVWTVSIMVLRLVGAPEVEALVIASAEESLVLQTSQNDIILVSLIPLFTAMIKKSGGGNPSYNFLWKDGGSL